MSLYRILAFDLRNGVARHWRRYAAIAAFFCLSVLALFAARKAYLDVYPSSVGPFTLGDCVVGAFSGMKEYVFDPRNPFDFPALWLLTFLLAAYLTLHYPYRDLLGVGRHLVVAAQSRVGWWYAKCLWVLASVGLFYAVCGAVLCLALLLDGGAFTLDVSPRTPGVLAFGHAVLGQPGGIWPLLVLLPLATVALCLLQLFLSLVIKPLPSYLCTVSLLFLSSYFKTPFLLGNYLMAARSEVFITGGMGFAAGAVLAGALIIVSVVAGRAWVQQMDIIEKESIL
ncbi:MAG: hypothetical protein LBG81_08890 [Coriobacteriaceae bacterium]|jgi:hypothetical protein|nr:hypothetical protein [Coriobacteriaceae bacterium]